MPDWSYHTVLRPLLFRLRPEASRDVALGAMGALAHLPGGVSVIRLLGHLAPDPRLRRERHGIVFPAPVGLGCRLDARLAATRAFGEFGLGYLEIGPVAATPGALPGRVERDPSAESLRLAAPCATMTAEDARARVAACGKLPMPLFARIQPASADEAARIVAILSPLVAAFVVPVERLGMVIASRPVFAAIDPNQWQDPAMRCACEQAASNRQIAGIIIDSPQTADGACELGPSCRAAVLRTLREIRTSLGPHMTLIAAAGIHAPADALDAVDAGADLLQIDSGLVFAGPGLAKRINEAMLYRQLHAPPLETPTSAAPPAALPPAPPRLAEQSWFWALLLGLSLLGGGVLAMAVAVTRVTLPYDEALTGLTHDQLAAINPRLLAFMTHDRVTLAGTMLAVGVQYVMLAACGIRRGLHWAYATVLTSALTGFFTFFAFLGFGYFDPFHAFISAILLQITLLAMHARLPVHEPGAPPELHNDEAWRSHQWGQLLFVIHGAVLIVAGTIITAIGMTQVFIREDLEFLGATAEQLIAAHPQLKPLIAHDRATFGGMLISCGLATLLPALWGFGRRQPWLWWTLMIAGNLAYLSALAVHLNVGYRSHLHLLPVYGGLMWLWAGGMFSYPFMAGSVATLDAEWRTRLAR